MEKTIAAISTAYGESGIGIVRMSGPAALSVLSEIFRPAAAPHGTDKDAVRALFESAPRTMHFGRIADGAEILDEALCVYFKAPFSYTGEDMAEIQCHGSLVAIKNILQLCLSKGAEAAERGEFTKRAFLSGKLDLSQAEAVIDLIKAPTGRSFNAAMEQKQGRLSAKVGYVREALKELLINITVNMDYPDEDIEEVQYRDMASALSSAADEVSKMLASAPEGKLLRDGLSLAIVGKPNVGKSSLMNLLLDEDRSIVTDLPGTTRDTIEESASLRGIPVRLTDTAGIRESADLVEALGIERSKEALGRADLLLLVLDGSRPLDGEDRALLDAAEGRPRIVLLNKLDLPQAFTAEELRNEYGDLRIIECSFRDRRGIEEIKDAAAGSIGSGAVRREDDVLVCNARHEQLLTKALDELKQAMALTKMGEALDFIEINVKSAFDYLGEITGDTASDEIINEIFARFCLGK